MAENEISKCPVKALVVEGSQECNKEILIKENSNLTDSNTNKTNTKSTERANSESIEKDEKQDGFPEPLRLRGGNGNSEIDNSNKESDKIIDNDKFLDKNGKERGNVTDEVKPIESELQTSENCNYEARQTQALSCRLESDKNTIIVSSELQECGKLEEPINKNETLIRIEKEHDTEENHLIYTEIKDKYNEEIIKHLCEDLTKSIKIENEEENITPNKVTDNMGNKDPCLCTDCSNSCTQELIMCDTCRKKIEQEIYFITNKIESNNEENEEMKQFQFLPVEVVFEVEYGDTNQVTNRSEENVQYLESCVNEAEVVWQKWQDEETDSSSNQRVEVIPGQVLQAWQIWQASQVGQAWLSCQSLQEQQLTGLIEFVKLGSTQNCQEETRECRGPREKWRRWIQIGQN